MRVLFALNRQLHLEKAVKKRRGTPSQSEEEEEEEEEEDLFATN